VGEQAGAVAEKALDVACVKLGDVAVNVRFTPAGDTLNPEKVATPDTALICLVPDNVPELTANVI
jgi:hypothetical protein